MKRLWLALLAVFLFAAPANANTLVGVGSNFHDNLGLGYLSGATFPAQPVQLLEAPVAFASSTALLADGELLSWGGNTFGQVGDGHQWVDKAFPVPIARNVVQANGACALTTDNVALGWGGNTYGQAGQGVSGGGTEQGGIRTAVPSPLPIKGLAPGHITELACTGPAHYAVYSTGKLYGWGNNSQSELGGTPSLEVLKPKLVATGVVEAVAAGASKYEGTLLMRHADGSVWALGTNNRGQAGIRKTSDAVERPGAREALGSGGPGRGLAFERDRAARRRDCGNMGPCGRDRHRRVLWEPLAVIHRRIRCLPRTARRASTVGFSTGYAVVAGSLVTWGLNDAGQADAAPSEGMLPPAVRATGAVRVVAAVQPGALIETTGSWAPPVINGTPGPGRAVTVRWSGGTGMFGIGLAECTGGPKERSTKSHSVGRTEAHEIVVPVPHEGEWEVSVGNTKTFSRKSVRVTVSAVGGGGV